MSTTDKGFFDFAMGETVNQTQRVWLEKIFTDFKDTPQCKSCGSNHVDIIIDPKATLKCRKCGQWSEGITLDKIRPMDYNVVIIQKEDILVNILKAQEKL